MLMKGKKKGRIAGLAMILTAALFSWSVPASADDVISDGIYVGDIRVGGKTTEEARELIEQYTAELGASKVTVAMGDGTIRTDLDSLGLTWDNPEVIREIQKLGTRGNILQRYCEKKDLQNENVHFPLKYSIDEDLERAFVEESCAYDFEPMNASIFMGEDGILYPDGGRDGQTVNVDATIGTLNEYIMNWEPQDITIHAEVTRKKAELSADTIESMNHVLGRAVTDYSASSAARSQNISNATAKINGTLLMPGEAFSVTAAVVPFSGENGYALAPSYESGQVVETYGGGICQVSTTLYNALLKAELEIDRRSNHTMTVSYVDPSKDAAIAEGVMDLVFTNDKDYPIYISGSAYYGTLTFCVYGVETRPANRTLEFVSEVTGRISAGNSVRLVARTDKSAGYVAQTQTPHEGLSAVLWKNIYVDGNLVDTIQVNSSTYQATSSIYEVGVATKNAAVQSALYTAIANNNLQMVQRALAGGR